MRLHEKTNNLLSLCNRNININYIHTWEGKKDWYILGVRRRKVV